MTHEDEASSKLGRAGSKRQFLAPLLPLAFVLPSTVIAVVSVVDEVLGFGPAAPSGWLGRPGVVGMLLTTVPTVLWASAGSSSGAISPTHLRSE